jgi:spore maturation protein CgeB
MSSRSAMHILYLGPVSGTCLDRANALRRMGHQVTHFDPRELLPRTVWVDRILWRLGGHWLSPVLSPRLARKLQGQCFDLCHVDNGEWISAPHIPLLKRHAPKVINYNIDDPTGPRDGTRFAAYRRAVPHYDLLAVVREDNLPELAHLGARRSLRVWRSADEVTHAPRELSAADHAKWDCDVLFLGTWMPERGPFLLSLIRKGVPLTIRGPNWQKAPEWAELAPHWKGGAIGGDDYAKAIQCARVNLGLLSKGNRDLHTTRSLEIPALGALFCAERTPEHMAMYEDGEEAVFWADADECARQCQALLADEARRLAIAQRGHERYLRNRHANQDILQQLLDEAACL